jgi:hypothetical protein
LESFKSLGGTTGASECVVDLFDLKHLNRAPARTVLPARAVRDLPLGKHIVWGDEAKPPVFATVADGFAVWATGEAMAVRLGNLFWLCIIIAGAWLLLAHSMGVDQDSPAMVYGGAGIALAVGWALRYIARRRLG